MLENGVVMGCRWVVMAHLGLELLEVGEGLLEGFGGVGHVDVARSERAICSVAFARTTGDLLNFACSLRCCSGGREGSRMLWCLS